ncbi:MAG: hypothetical protein R2864_12235 [Syntrophotaleaceae bacterium]
MKGMGEKHCCKEDLLLYYYDELEGHRHRELVEHLATCADCCEEWQRLQAALEQVPIPTLKLAPGETRLPPGWRRGRSVAVTASCGCGVAR